MPNSYDSRSVAVEVRIGSGVCNNSLAELLGYDKGWSCSCVSFLLEHSGGLAFRLRGASSERITIHRLKRPVSLVLFMRWSVCANPAAAFRWTWSVVSIACGLVPVHLHCYWC